MQLHSSGLSSKAARERWPLPWPMARIARPWQASTGRQARADTKLGVCRTWGSAGGTPRLPVLVVGLALGVVALGAVAMDPWEAFGTAAPALHGRCLRGCPGAFEAEARVLNNAGLARVARPQPAALGQAPPAGADAAWRCMRGLHSQTSGGLTLNPKPAAHSAEPPMQHPVCSPQQDRPERGLHLSRGAVPVPRP